MAERVELAISQREALGKASKRLRKEGKIPGNIYGHNEPSQAIQLEAAAYEHLRRARLVANILTLMMPDGTTQTVLVRRVQRDPITDKPLHIDFARVSLDERITMKIPLRFVGESPAVKNEGGVLLHLMEAIEVECLASEIVNNIEVDISSLNEIDAMLHASDVQLPANYTLVTDANEGIVKVGATRAEVAEEEAAAEEKPAAAAEETPAAAEP